MPNRVFFFWWIPESVADPALVNFNGIKTLLTNGIAPILANGKPTFKNCPRSLLRNPPDWTFPDIRVFNNFISIGEQIAKKLQVFAIFLTLGDDLFGKLTSLL